MHASIFTYIHASIFIYMHAFITWDRILKRMMRLPRERAWSQGSNVEFISVLQFQMSLAFHIHRSLSHFFGNRAGLMSHVLDCSTVQVLVRFGQASISHPSITFSRRDLALNLYTTLIIQLEGGGYTIKR